MTRPSDSFFRRMRARDPLYGEQEHQRRYLQSIDDRDAKKPCPNVDPTHEHSDACYVPPAVPKTSTETPKT